MARPTHDAPLDLGLILDLSPNWPYSASMAARQEQAAHALVDQLRPGDQLALGWYDSNGANYAPTLTSELAVVHEQITSLYANASGNNSYPMMGDALWSMTMALADQSDPARNRSIIAFGDGGGWSSPSDAWTGAFSVAIGHEIPYNFVAFEPLFLEYQVQAMADMTGGVLVKVKPDEAPRAAMNGKVYAASAGRAIDSDHDGLADTLEAAGLRDGTGHRYSTDPAKADTDGDGLSDGAEVGELRSDGAYASRTYYKLRSNPTAFDSDRDGLSDLYETANVLRPLAADNDRDGLNDFEEVQQQSTDPYLADTDGDGMSDSFEYYNRAQGTDPLVADAQLTALEYAGEFARGALCGDVEGWGGFCDSTQIPYLAGSLFAGFVIIGDVRDFVANAFGGQLGWAALNVVALVPAGGDAVSIVAKSVKFVHRIQPPTTLSLRSGASSVAAQDASAVRKWVLELDLPEYLKDRFLKESVGPSVNVLLDEGISSKSLIRMAKRGGRLDVLADAVRRADSVRSTKKPAGDYLLEQDAEDELRAVLRDDTPRAML
jgi:hypothetical protein